MDDSLICKGRWLKIMMKHVIAVVEQGIGLVKRIRNIEVFMDIEVDGKISLQVFGEHTSHDSFIKIIHLQLHSDLSLLKQPQMYRRYMSGQKNFPSVLELLHHLPHNTVSTTPHPCQCNLH
jgi:hypothetical protein